ncbi:hypothetical protein KSW81_001167 [Nannochloris sp. 'desiccata']|nr:hypothetical protein KSW81_001167 [Chlorella desiccata (nom. nud.)]
MTINNYAKACADPVNNKCPTPPTNCNDFCKACDLYVNHIQGKTGVFTETSERGGHRLVVPIAPCRGVEDWKEKKCGGEDIWDHAWGFAGGPDFVAYGNSANEDNDVTVVAQPLGPGKGVVVLRANDRPAECFLYCQDVCQDRCT